MEMENYLDKEKTSESKPEFFIHSLLVQGSRRQRNELHHKD